MPLPSVFDREELFAIASDFDPNTTIPLHSPPPSNMEFEVELSSFAQLQPISEPTLASLAGPVNAGGQEDSDTESTVLDFTLDDNDDNGVTSATTVEDAIVEVEVEDMDEDEDMDEVEDMDEGMSVLLMTASLGPAFMFGHNEAAGDESANDADDEDSVADPAPREDQTSDAFERVQLAPLLGLADGEFDTRNLPSLAELGLLAIHA
ncbi:hypothetical protein DENSPDRAFT_931416 [Dentipellis sp. KUC8613]|nr:hypothetical protein DENSPDRAFT_931416 [Dentipellis sp. KUC8613]